MLEAAIVLEVVLGKYVEAAIIAGLLAFNAALGYFQEVRLFPWCSQRFWRRSR
jgi:H+-transporting ATPase